MAVNTVPVGTGPGSGSGSTTPPQSATPSGGRRRVRRRRVSTGIWNVIAVAFSLVMFFPVYWMVVTAFKPAPEVLTFHPNFIPLHPTFDNFSSALHAQDFLTDLKNSLIITGSSVLLGLVVGFLGAIALARFNFPGRRAAILVLLGVQMVPLISVIIPIYLQLQKWHQTDQLLGVIVTYLVLLLPFITWMLRGFVANVPRELDEAALVDGATRGQAFVRVLLPLTLPGLVAAAIYGFIQAWNEFIIINTLNNPEKQNLMAWLLQNQTNRGTAWGPLMAGAIITALPVVVFFLVIQRNIAAGLTAGAVKG